MSRSTQRVVRIIHMLRADEAGHRLVDLARLLDAPKGSLVPVLRELVEAGLLVRDASGRYRSNLSWKDDGSQNPAEPDDPTLVEVLGALVARVTAAVRAHGVSVFLWDAAENLLRPIYSYSIIGHEHISVRPGEGIAGQVWVKDQPILVPDYMLWEHAIPRYRTNIWRSQMGALLRQGGRSIGVVVARSHDDTLRFTEADLAALQRLSDEAARALHA